MDKPICAAIWIMGSVSGEEETWIRETHRYKKFRTVDSGESFEELGKRRRQFVVRLIAAINEEFRLSRYYDWQIEEYLAH